MHSAEFSILLHRALEARLERLLELAAAPNWKTNPEGLHDVRVASRRVRAVLELVESAIYPGFKRHWRRLRDLTRALGATRELDVHLGILDAMKHPGLEATHQAALEHVQEILDRSRRKACRRMNRGLAKADPAECAGLLRVPNLPDPFAPGTVIEAAWACLEPRLRSLLALLEALHDEDVPALHDLRIRVKKLRYTLEILAPGLAGSAEEPLERLRRLQTVLGDHHDLATLEAELWGIHSALTERRRTVLATGILDIIGLTAERRRATYEQFRALAPSVTWELLAAPLHPESREGGAP